MLLRAFDAGAVDYVTKPFMPEELLARVNAHIGLKLTRDRLERVARERQELVNLVAHDLKNPLSSVLFASDILLQGGVQARARAALPADDPRKRRRCARLHPPLPGSASHGAAARRRLGPGLGDLAETLDWLLRRYEMQLEARGMPRHADAAAGRGLRRHRRARAAPGRREPGDQRDQVRPQLRTRPGRAQRRARLLAADRRRPRRRASPRRQAASAVQAVHPPARRQRRQLQRPGPVAGQADRRQGRRPALVRGARRRRRAVSSSSCPKRRANERGLPRAVAVRRSQNRRLFARR